MKKMDTLVNTVVNALWTSISSNRGDSGSYLYDSISVCLCLLYCKHKGYDVKLDSPQFWENVNSNDELLKAFSKVTTSLAMRHLKVAHSFKEQIQELPYDEFENAYPDIIAEILTYTLSSRDMSEFVTPEVLVRVFSAILGKYSVRSVYNPFAGTAAFSSLLDKDVLYVGEEIAPRICTFAMFRIESLKKKNAFVYCKDSINSMLHIDYSYDAIIANMPWGRLYAHHNIAPESFFLEKAAYATNGISIGFYPYDILVSPLARQLRESLLKADCLQAVIKLPTWIFGTQHRRQSCIIITNKHKQDTGHVQFIDATQYIDENEQFSVDELMSVLDFPNETRSVKRVPCEQLISANCFLALETLMQGTITAPKGFHTERLGNIIQPIRRSGQTPEDSTPVVKLSDLSNKPFEDNLSILSIGTFSVQNVRPVYLQKDAILISTVGKPRATFYAHKGDGVLVHPNIAAYEIINSQILPKYIVRELWQPYVVQQLVYSGSAMERLSIPLFEEVKILVPDNYDPKIQEALIEETYQEQLSDSERKLKEAYNEYKSEISTRKHAIENTLSGPVLDLKSFIKFMERHDGHVSFDNVVGESNPLTAKQELASILNRLKVVEMQIAHLNMFDDNYGESVPVDLDDFIQHFILTFPSGRYKYSYSPSEDNVPRVEISKRVLDTVFNNIISNAQSHGFIDDRTDYEIDFALYAEEDNVVLEIANNGAPLDAEISSEAVFEYYRSSKFGQEGHSGLGGYDIRRLLKKYDATVELVSNPDQYFTVIYRIRFVKIKNEDSNN